MCMGVCVYQNRDELLLEVKNLYLTFAPYCSSETMYSLLMEKNVSQGLKGMMSCYRREQLFCKRLGHVLQYPREE